MILRPNPIGLCAARMNVPAVQCALWWSQSMPFCTAGLLLHRVWLQPHTRGLRRSPDMGKSVRGVGGEWEEQGGDWVKEESISWAESGQLLQI